MDTLQSLWHVLRQLGGPGLFLMGILDSSVLPTMGSQDLLTVLLAAAHSQWWLYYAAMATGGSVLGGYLTYRLGRKGGSKALEQRGRGPAVDKLARKFEKIGFGTIFFPAMLPPPFPIVPSLLGAGAMKYPLRRFLAALAAGRAVRFTLLACVASVFGRRALTLFQQNAQTLLVVSVVLAVLGLSAVLLWRRLRKTESSGAV